jgi:hypothetical protein
MGLLLSGWTEQASWVKIDPPRPLSPEERLMLDLVLSSDFAGVDDLREQVKSALVVGGCDCGCPTVDLRVERTAARAESAWSGPAADGSSTNRFT